MAFGFRNSADSADLTTWSPTTDAALEWLLYCDRGAAGAGPSNTWLYLRVEDPDNPGTWLTSGHPALDAQELQVRIIGSLNPGGDPDFAAVLTGWTRLGAGAVLQLPAWRGDCAVRCESRWILAVGSSGSQEPFAYELAVGQGAPPAAALPLLDGDGIIAGIGDSTLTRWIDWLAVTPTGTPDDQVHLVARRWLDGGVITYEAAADVTLNQTDGDSATLGSGEEYKAILTQAASSVTVTKGSKALAGAATWPNQPAGEPLAARITVPYGVSGSVITDAEIVSLVVADRFEVRAGVGLTAIVAPGRAVLARQYVASDLEQTVILTASVTRYLYLAANGDLSLETSLAAPSLGARPLATIVTDGSGVTSLTDLRDTWREPRAECLRLAQAGNETTGTDVARIAVNRPSCLDRGTVAVRTASAGATGSTDVTLVRTRAGTPADIGTASIAAGGYSAVLTLTAADLQAGDYLSLDVDAVTSGGSRAADIAVTLVACPV